MEWWWMEKVERNLLWLLRIGEGDRLSVRKARLLKRWIRECDPVRSWPVDERRLERIRIGVMSAIESGERGSSKD